MKVIVTVVSSLEKLNKRLLGAVGAALDGGQSIERDGAEETDTQRQIGGLPVIPVPGRVASL